MQFLSRLEIRYFTNNNIMLQRVPHDSRVETSSCHRLHGCTTLVYIAALRMEMCYDVCWQRFILLPIDCRSICMYLGCWDEAMSRVHHRPSLPPMVARRLSSLSANLIVSWRKMEKTPNLDQ